MTTKPNGETRNLPHPAQATSEVHETVGRPVSLLASVGLLYISFGVIFGILQGGLPPILRAQGIDVGSLGWLAAVLIPFGLTFLWAPLVDRVAPYSRAPRIAWIAIMQSVVVLLLVAIAYAGSGSLHVVFGLTLAIAFAEATMDIALDALACRTVRPVDRMFAGGIKVGSLAIGSLVGGGLFVVYFHRAGWTNIFLIVAVLTILATLPILTQTRWDQSTETASAAKRPSLLGTLRKPYHRQHLIILGTVSLPIVMLFGLNRIMLVDAGLSLDQIGAIAGTLSPLGSLLATALAVALMRRFGAVPSIATFTVICLIAVGMVIAGFQLDDHTELTMAGAVTATAGASGLYVVICAIVLGWANTEQPATDYAALYGISRLGALIVLMTMAQIIPVIGWSAFYAASGCLLVAAAMVFGLAISRKEIDVGW